MTTPMPYLGNGPQATVRCLQVANIGPGFRIFNPSVVMRGTQILSSFRASNVEKCDRTGKFFLSPPHRKITNEIIFGELNEDFTLKRQVQVALKSTGGDLSAHGIEDLRIVASPEGRIEAMGCIPSSNYLIKPQNELGFGKYYSTKMGRIQLTPDYEIEKVIAYESPFGRRMEKNWSPFYHEGKFCVVYQWNPLVILELLPGGTSRFLKWFDASEQLKDMRGSSQGLPTESGFLFVVHRKRIIDGKVRFSHQLIELGHDLQPRRISDEFGLFTGTMIEYCAGLAREKNRYLFSFGLNDSTPFMMAVEEEMIERLLLPLKAPIVENRSILSASPETFAQLAAAEFPTESPLGLMDHVKWNVGRVLQALRK